jgi:FkbM family methyltransferase
MLVRRAPASVRGAYQGLGAQRAGLDVSKLRDTPFGVRWEEDLAALGPVNLAVDVGANEGQTAQLIASAFPSARIFSYEPVPATFEVLQRRYAGSPDITCIQAAMGAEVGRAQITTGPISGQNTLITDAKPDQPTVEVPVTTLAVQAIEHGWNEIDLLKVDTEGYEVEVLDGAQQLLRDGLVRFVLVECDFVRRPSEPHGFFPDIYGLLDPLRYRVVAFYTAAVDGQGWIWGDVLFMKETRRRQVLFTPTPP